MKRSKGVSQRELAKLLEVSRWTIQQAVLDGKCTLGTERGRLAAWPVTLAGPCRRRLAEA